MKDKDRQELNEKMARLDGLGDEKMIPTGHTHPVLGMSYKSSWHDYTHPKTGYNHVARVLKAEAEKKAGFLLRYHHCLQNIMIRDRMAVLGYYEYLHLATPEQMCEAIDNAGGGRP